LPLSTCTSVIFLLIPIILLIYVYGKIRCQILLMGLGLLICGCSSVKHAVQLCADPFEISFAGIYSYHLGFTVNIIYEYHEHDMTLLCLQVEECGPIPIQRLITVCSSLIKSKFNFAMTNDFLYRSVLTNLAIFLV
jgi:hypothetical protein